MTEQERKVKEGEDEADECMKDLAIVLFICVIAASTAILGFVLYGLFIQ